MKNLIKTMLVIGSLTLACAASAADSNAHGQPGKNPRNYTCDDLLVTDIEYVPEIVYWHDGWNAKTDTLSETIDEDWMPIAVDEVLTECRKDRTQRVSDVVSKHRALHRMKK